MAERLNIQDIRQKRADQLAEQERLRLIRQAQAQNVLGSQSVKLSLEDKIIDTDNWEQFAECRKDSPDNMFVTGADQNVAKKICLRCVVRPECLQEALDNQIEWGVWGGMTERERRALLRNRKKVEVAAK
jgi:WhiB family redox-sensing transcriptional regulator